MEKSGEEKFPVVVSICARTLNVLDEGEKFLSFEETETDYFYGNTKESYKFKYLIDFDMKINKYVSQSKLYANEIFSFFINYYTDLNNMILQYYPLTDENIDKLRSLL